MKTRSPLSILLVALATLVPLAAAGCAAKADSKAAPAASGRVAITVTQKGFEPDHIAVKRGEPVTLAFTRKTDKTCATSVTIHTSDTDKVERDLPLDKTVEIPLSFAKTGELRYACSMDMITGVIRVE